MKQLMVLTNGPSLGETRMSCVLTVQQEAAAWQALLESKEAMWKSVLEHKPKVRQTGRIS